MLTPREFEVLQLLGKGLSSKEIAGKLQLSPHTVDEHRGHLLEKFHARNSIDLVAKAMREKWIK